ncbi:unnamed protein product [Phytophthora fragariaefolia]|uniref:Unnamed protein product n=1 Tax=Phytophthora fragariaefolia TaxID=1490495 RepID=A0A9W6YJK8_9STRA|nr:unnamed protein product [Phytophthora fragariaefolia]
MVRVPGSLGDSGFHREPPQEDTQSEFGHGNEASTNIGSPTTPLNQDRSAERQSFKRSATDGTEGGPVMDLEDKPRPPPQVPLGTPAGLDENLDPLDESPPAQAGTNTSIQPRSGRLLTGLARNWYRQLSRTTRSTWKDLHQSFQAQYCGRGVSVARQYYQTRKRPDESPLEYLHRLNVAGLRTRLQIKDGPQEVRREHVEHFIETLDDRDLADQLALLRIPDADILEEVLRSRQRAKSRQSKTVYGSIKPRQKSPAAAAGTRAVRAVHVPEESSDSDEESRSSSDEDLRRVVGREDVKLERSPSWNPVRAERSRFCIYAYVEKQSKAAVNKVIDNTCDLQKESATAIANLHQTDEYSRSEVKMILDISSGESRGYWKYHVPDKKFQQAKAVGKINNAKATLLFDSGAEVSILDTAFARKVGCYVDNSQTLQCEGVGKSPYMAEGRTCLKITLAGSLVYFFDAWVGPPTGGKYLILGMDFMVPAGIRLDLADGTICLPDEVRIQLAGRRPLYGDKVEQVTMEGYYEIDMGGSKEARLRTRPSDRQKLWRKLILHGDTKIAMWLTGDRVPRLPGYVSVGSRRYAEWQNLAYQATTDENGVTPKQGEVQGPAVKRPLYQTPTATLKRPPICPAGTAAARQIKGRGRDIDSLHNVQDSLCNAQGLQLPSAEASCTQKTTSRAHGATNKVGMCSAHVMQNQGHGTSDLDQRLNTSANQWRNQRRVEGQWRNQRRVEGRATNPDGLGDFSGEHKQIPADDATSTHSAPVDLGDRAVDPGDEEVCIKESGDLYAEDVEGRLAVLPEVIPTTEEVKIEDIQVGNPNDNKREQVDQLKQIIWRRRHLLIGKGNALPPAAKGAICDIDAGNAKPVAQRVRKVAPQFREKLFQLIKGLLSANIIQHLTSPWASPIVVIIKKNGIDIRLCIDYWLVNSLTRLTVCTYATDQGSIGRS